MDFKEDVNSGLIMTIGAMSGFLVIVVVIGLQAWFLLEEQYEARQKFANHQNTQLENLRNAQRANISAYRWMDTDKKVAAVPIEQAMTLLIEHQGKLPTTQPTTQRAR